MARQRDNELTIEQKLEIRTMNRNKKQMGITTADIAEKFSKSRQTISQVINDKSLAALEHKGIVKEETRLIKNSITVLERIYDKVLLKLDKRLDDDDIKSTDLIKAIKEVSTQLNLLAGKPTKIVEERKLSVDLNVITKLPGDKILDYLSTGDIKTIDYELQGEIKEEDRDTVEVEITDGGTPKLSTE